MHFQLMIIVPEEFYISKDNDKLMSYVRKVMSIYSAFTETNHRLFATSEENKKAFEEYQNSKDYDKKHNTVKKFLKMAGLKWDKKGNSYTTYNKKAEYDYYLVGGRWNGEINDKEKEYDEDISPDELIRYNSIQVKEFINKKKFNDHIIDKDNILHKKRKYLLDFENNKSEEVWNIEYKNVLENSLDDFILCMDCHT